MFSGSGFDYWITPLRNEAVMKGIEEKRLSEQYISEEARVAVMEVFTGGHLLGGEGELGGGCMNV